MVNAAPLGILGGTFNPVHLAHLRLAQELAQDLALAKVRFIPTGTPPHREIQKTALGATESVSWEYFEHPVDAIRQLKAQGYKIIIIEQTSESIPLHTFNISSAESYCLVFGNEVNGVSDEIVAEGNIALEIPQVGTKHSLNVSVCLGIVIWELFKKMTIDQH